MKKILTAIIFLSTQAYGACPVSQTGKVHNPHLIENSGMDFSRTHQDVIWSLNDSRHSPKIYALKSTGEGLGEFNIIGATNSDWEDIAVARCFHNPKLDCIYAADIGNNKRNRDTLSIYVIEEPQEFKGQDLKPVQVLNIKSPNKNFESLSYNERTSEFYLFSKIKRSSSKWSPELYKFSPGETELTRIVDLDFKSPGGLKVEDAMITASDFDSVKEVFLIGTYGKAYEISLQDIGSFWEKARVIDMPAMKKAEAITYGPRHSIFTSSEGVNMSIYKIVCD